MVVEVDDSEYDKLIEDQNFLRALEAAGVDNWGGYDNAVDIFEEDNDND